jgi:AAA+ ATPase superfamily predicted ATPase
MISGRTPREWDENMKFIGRSAELSALDRMYGKNSFEMMILYGRRRVGKTTLLKQFAEGKNVLFYTGVRVKTARISLNSEEQCFHIFSNVNAAGIEFRA